MGGRPPVGGARTLASPFWLFSLNCVCLPPNNISRLVLFFAGFVLLLTRAVPLDHVVLLCNFGMTFPLFPMFFFFAWSLFFSQPWPPDHCLIVERFGSLWIYLVFPRLAETFFLICFFASLVQLSFCDPPLSSSRIFPWRANDRNRHPYVAPLLIWVLPVSHSVC